MIKQNKQQSILFSIVAGGLLTWLVYANSTGWQIFSSNSGKQAWNSSGPGYHK